MWSERLFFFKPLEKKTKGFKTSRCWEMTDPFFCVCSHDIAVDIEHMCVFSLFYECTLFLKKERKVAFECTIDVDCAYIATTTTTGSNAVHTHTQIWCSVFFLLLLYGWCVCTRAIPERENKSARLSVSLYRADGWMRLPRSLNQPKPSSLLYRISFFSYVYSIWHILVEGGVWLTATYDTLLYALATRQLI